MIWVTPENSGLPPTRSRLAFVLMMVATGLSLTAATESRTGLPQPGSFVSIKTAPSSRMSAIVLPPPPFSTYKMSGRSTSAC